LPVNPFPILIHPPVKLSLVLFLFVFFPFSGYSYVEALQSAARKHLFPALGRCMSYFGGVPQNVLSDNMKQYVHKK